MHNRRATYVWGLLLAAAMMAGCGDDDDGGMPPVDGGPVDSGADGGVLRDSGVDAGGIDAGVDDAGGLDAGGIDAGDIDAGDIDAGGTDAGDIDAGGTDAGGTDAGGTDAGSGDTDGGVDLGTMTSDLGTDGGGTDAGAPDAGPVARCPAVSARTIVDVPEGPLAAGSTRWTCDNIYQLNGIVLVYSDDAAAPQTLTIEPGTIIRGNTSAASRGFLVVTRNGRIDADGTAEDPIVFTSAAAVGSRARDDWGGITMLGRAFRGGTRRTEGFPTTTPSIGALDPFLDYGPIAPAAADDTWDCGTLRYVRVEFASFNAGGAMGNESNALQLYSCGSGTTIDFVQTHYSGDDGIEVFGGTVDIRHFVVTAASDDLFDWDDGWRGRAQFLVGQQYDDAADLGFEAGGGSDTPTTVPDPRLFNVTLVGSTTAGQVGGRLRGASRGYLRNFIFFGFRDGFLDIGGMVAAANLLTDPPVLSVRNSVFAQGASTIAWPSGSDDAADGSLIEQDFFSAASELNQTIDPMLARPTDLANPGFVPAAAAPTGAANAEAPSEAAGDTRPAFFDTSAAYVGAFAPGGADWTAGWTAYPAN
jgi:hypothetical protein